MIGRVGQIGRVGMGRRRAGGVVPPTLPNRDFFQFGDSRTEDGSSPLLTGTGYQPRMSCIGVTGWLAAETGNRIRFGRYANFGISAATSSQSAANPRRSAGIEPPDTAVTTGLWYRGPAADGSGSSNKGSAIAETHSAGIGILKCFVNDRTTGDWTQAWANCQSILNATPSKVWIILNETALGLNDSGATQNGAADAAFKAFSDRLLTLDYASGHADSRSNVIVIDTFALSWDVATGTNYRNVVGYLRDGLHDAPHFARLQARAINTRLTAIYGAAWTSLPSWALAPTANGLVTPANTQPFIHTNPILTPGTNGTVLGTWSSAPAASGVPQGWTIGSSGTSAGLTAVCTKGTETDGAGNEVWIVQISGTLAANSTGTVTLSQTLNSTALANAFAATPARVSINDAFRARCKMKVAPGSQLLTQVSCQATIGSGTATKNQTATALGGTTTGPGNYVGNGSGSNTLDAFQWDEWVELVTDLIDQQDPNMVAAGRNIASTADVSLYGYSNVLTFRNNTGGTLPVSATVRLALAGMYRCTGDQLHNP